MCGRNRFFTAETQPCWKHMKWQPIPSAINSNGSAIQQIQTDTCYWLIMLHCCMIDCFVQHAIEQWGWVSRFLMAHQHKQAIHITHVGIRWKIWAEDWTKNRHYLKLSTTQKRQTTQNTAKQNYPVSVAFYGTQPGNKVDLFYSASEPTCNTINR